MNELIAKLYDQAIVIEDGGDYVTGELDPKKFAELIVRECADVGSKCSLAHPEAIRHQIKKHFGVRE